MAVGHIPKMSIQHVEYQEIYKNRTDALSCIIPNFNSDGFPIVKLLRLSEFMAKVLVADRD